MSESAEKRDYRRNKIIEAAVNAADRIILDGSDGSKEETDRLTAEVATHLVHMAFLPLYPGTNVFQTINLFQPIKNSERSVSLRAFEETRIIVANNLGFKSEEENNYLTAEIAKRFTEKALRPFSAKMLKKDIEMDAGNGQQKQSLFKLPLGFC